nr:hypothetical protein [Lachnospiraceae bacterium]
GFIGYFMKKDKWWGYLILFPMILITANSYYKYLNDFLFYMPKYILISVFCACVMILYPVMIFENKKIRLTGAIIGAVAVIGISAYVFVKPDTYTTEIMLNGDEYSFDDTYKVSIADDKYGDVEIIYFNQLQDYAVRADFKRAGKTVITLESPDGEKKDYNITIERDTYEIEPK